MKRITLDVKEVAQMLNVSKYTIYTMCREGEIPHFKVRGRILFNKDVVIAWTRGEYEHETESVTV